MSAGAFTIVNYQASYDDAVQHPIRVQPETTTAATAVAPIVENLGATGLDPNPISAVSSLTQRSLGLKPRAVNLELSGTPPTGYIAGSRTSIPALTIDFYNACVRGTTVNYLGTEWTVVSRTPEYAR